MSASPSFSRDLLKELPRIPQNSKASNMKKQQFCYTSTLYLYDKDRLYDQTKSYSSSDKKRFSQDALRDAVRIKRTLLRNANESNLPMATQLKACGIPKEEIVGLEQLILEEPTSTFKRRKNHAQAVLMEYANQLKEGKDDIHKLAKLAKLSANLTKRRAPQAQNRAARSA